MRKFIKSTIASLLVIILLISSCLPIFAVDATRATQPTQYSKQYNSGSRDIVCTSLDGTSALAYYGSEYSYDKLSAMSSGALLLELRELMSTTHTTYTSYNDCHYKANQTDCVNGDGTIVSYIYSAYSATMEDWAGSGNVGWNREHVWPKSLGGYDNNDKPGCDMHHVRPSDAKINSTRNNHKYGNVANHTTTEVNGNSYNGTTIYGGFYANGYFEPYDNVKGDVARICLYMYVRWGGEYSGNSSITNVFQSVDVLLEWCEIDPVDTWEMGRNEVVQSLQGNRNVFIDYPELAWIIFDEDIPAGMTTPSGNAANIETACKHASTKLVGAVAASCISDGYTGDTVCTECEIMLVKGKEISSGSMHQWSDWVIDEVAETQTRYCSVCQNDEIVIMSDIVANIESDAEKILLLMILGSTDVVLLDELYQQ